MLLLCLFINIVTDPLWYFEGNSIKNKNFAFNERLSKTNRFLKSRHDYDSLIFGSSRTTVLNETLIENYRCFNYSFSGGRIEEFSAFASYIKDTGFTPRLIIIGVDDFNFEKNDDKEEIVETQSWCR